MSDLIGLESLVVWPDLRVLLARLAIDMAVISIVTQLVYFRLYRNREHVFTCHLLNLVTLCLCLLLRKGPAELGFGLTMFGVFAVLRYRTEQICSRDLTYLFIAIALGIVNGVAHGNVSVADLLVVNGVIVTTTAVLELGLRRPSEGRALLLYDRLELLQPGREADLVADIANRTGLAVGRVETQRIDLLRDAAEITIYFRPQAGPRE